MAKKMLIDATHPEETRVVVVDGNQVDEFDFETASKRQLAGNIYLAKVTRVEPSLQAAFVDYGGNRHGFLAFAEIHPDYYQIPAEDRKALLEEERAEAEAAEAEEDAREERAAARGRAGRAEDAGTADRTSRADADSDSHSDPLGSEAIPGMEVLEHDSDAEDGPEAIGADATSDGNGADAGADLADGPSTASEERRPPARKPRARRYKIQEVIRVRQIMLVQVVKEERGNKGAALTTYLSLAGRYCVLMPNTARGGGISRKITNAADRKKLKEISTELRVPQGAGLIIRTAGAERTKTEIRRDYEYLMRLWEEIRDLTFRSVAPAPIYEEGDLIKRSIRDLYSREIDEVLVEGERGYRTAKDFMKMIMPSHARNVKHHTDPMPLFTRYQVESYLAGMFNPVVQLKSGGYIVIGITEALVAIDVNSGRATKEGSIEETATKTNLEAADEIARQLRLRDLAGLIVVDFIDMDERKNNAAVEKRFKDRLKSDRARIQVGRISGFGLLEMSRQRLHPGMLESTTQPCSHCHGTGLIRSNDSMALAILRSIEEEGTRKRSREVVVRAPVAVANFLINQKRDHIAQIEARTGMSVMIEADLALISPDWTMERFKTATRNLAPPENQAVSVSAGLMAEIDEAHAEDENDGPDVEADADAEARNGKAADGSSREDEDSAEDHHLDAQEDGEGGTRSTRRRRRRRRRNGSDHAAAEHEGSADEAAASASDEAGGGKASGRAAAGDAADDGVTAETAGADAAGEDGEAAAGPGTEKPAPASRSRSRGRRSSRTGARSATDEGGQALVAEAEAAPDTAATDEAVTTAAGEAEAAEAMPDSPEAIAGTDSGEEVSQGAGEAVADVGGDEAVSEAGSAPAQSGQDGSDRPAGDAAAQAAAGPDEEAASAPAPLPEPEPAAEAEVAAEAAPEAQPETMPEADAQADPVQRPNGADAAASRPAPGEDDDAAPVPANTDMPAAASTATDERPKRRGWWSQ